MTYRQEQIKPYSEEGAKGQQVERMFDSIAHSYDLLNHTLSLGLDRSWRRAAVDSLKPYAPQQILDIATGTGDFALLTMEGMLAVGREKVEKAGYADRITLCKEDCMALSFADDTFDALTVAYGVRNFEDLDRGLREMRRVLRPGGRLVIIELTSPVSFPMKQLFWLYAHAWMPTVGRLISRDARAYQYLPATMEAFPQGEVMKAVIEKAGFRKGEFRRFTFGLSTLYTAEK